MSRIGQEGDTRPYRRLRRSDYYEAKSAVEAEKREEWPRCSVCGQEIRGANFGTEEEPIDLRCWSERSGQ